MCPDLTYFLSSICSIVWPGQNKYLSIIFFTISHSIMNMMASVIFMKYLSKNTIVICWDIIKEIYTHADKWLPNCVSYTQNIIIELYLFIKIEIFLLE